MNQHDFPESLLAEADILTVPDSLLSAREHVSGITIDGSTSLDLDDAIDLEYSPAEFIVHVSIADVSELIRSGSPLFQEALQRTTTQYRSKNNIPMLPRSLSEGSLSLFEQQMRPTITFSITLSRELEIKNTEIRKTVLKSRRRFNYIHTDFIMDSCPDDPDFQLLNDCYILARRLLDMRQKNGALAIYDLQKLLFTNEEGNLISMNDEDAHKSNIIVQEFMILANSAFAEFAARKELLFLFRNHTARKTTPERSEILEQLQTAVDNPQRIIILGKRAGLWFNKATYDPVLKGHYGLNLPAYAHLTSPLRRITDLINHELLKAQLWGDATTLSIERLNEFSTHINSVQNELSLHKRKFFTDQTRAESRTLLTHTSVQNFSAMDSAQFKQIIKEACRSKIFSEQLEQSFDLRLSEKKVGVEHLAIILFETTATTEQLVRVRSKALTYALETLGFANQLLHFQVQSGRLINFQVDIEEFHSGYAARIVASVNENNASTTMYSYAINKKEAQNSAAIEFLTAYLSQTLVLSSTTKYPLIPDETIINDVHQKDELTEGDNFVGTLGEFCLQRKIVSTPRYSFLQEGPTHNPIIRCLCSLSIEDILKETSGTASNKKTAKQIAAKLMMQEISDVLPSVENQHSETHNKVAISDEFIEENFAGKLQDVCVQAKWQIPRFEFSHTGKSHAPLFTCRVTVKIFESYIEGVGTASSKKIAKQIAAREALKKFT